MSHEERIYVYNRRKFLDFPLCFHCEDADCLHKGLIACSAWRAIACKIHDCLLPTYSALNIGLLPPSLNLNMPSL